MDSCFRRNDISLAVENNLMGLTQDRPVIFGQPLHRTQTAIAYLNHSDFMPCSFSAGLGNSLSLAGRQTQLERGNFAFFLFTCEKQNHLSLSRQSRACFLAGFAVRYFKPSKGGGERVLNPNVIYHYHGKAVLTFRRTP